MRRAVSSNMQARKVLVADDSAFVHRIYKLTFPELTLVHAYNGKEAVDRLASERDIDLVLLDINMPVMSGLEVLAELRDHPQRKRMAVVVVSTEVKPEDTGRYTAAGADAVMKKAFGGAALREMVRDLPERKP